MKYLSLVCTFLLIAVYQIGPGEFVNKMNIKLHDQSSDFNLLGH